MVPWCWKYALKKVRMGLITYEVESHLVDESGDIVDIEEKIIIIEALQKLPVGNCGDGGGCEYKSC